MHWWLRGWQREQELERELQLHLDLEAAEHEDSGVSAKEAVYAARRALGNTTFLKEEVREMWGWASLERWLQDFRFAARILRKTPVFVLFAVLALALGLGANAAIFAVVQAVLLQPLPFRDAGRLVEVWEKASHLGFPLNTPAPANFADWKRRNHVFADMAALVGDLYALTGSGTPEQLETSRVTANLFPLLGVSPIVGRPFTSDEDRPGGPRVVMLGYALWQERFRGDRAVVGREIWLNGQKYRVVGVMPRGVSFPERSQIWLPLALGPRELARRDNHYLRVFARLKRDIPLAQAQREMAAVAAQLTREYPETNTNIGAVVIGLRDQLAGNLKLALVAVAAGVGCVLLIACANLAGLLLARAAARGREFAVRAALGAGRTRLVRQTLVESLLLAGIGGGAGLLVAELILPFLRHLVPGALSAWAQPRVDLSLLGFLLLLSGSTAVVFGTLPAWIVSRTDLSAALQQGGRAAIGGSTRIRRLLIVGEVAFTVILLIGAGLLAKTLWALSHVPLGFQPEGVMTLRTSLAVSADSPYRTFQVRSQFYQRVLDQVTSIPGVVSAGYTTYLPLSNAGGTSGFFIEGVPPPPSGINDNDANHRVISANYLQTLGVRLRAGRFLRDSDGPDAPPVVLINEAMARQYWPGENPLGHRIRLYDFAGDQRISPWIRIVGVVENIRQMGLAVESRAEMYFPCTQPAASFGYFTPRDLAVRVKGDPMSYANALERAVWAADRDQPVADLQPLPSLIADQLASREIAVDLMAAFAALALLLAALGVYGLLAYVVLQRRREIGVRMALGAQPAEVSAAVLREGLRLMLWGLAFGAAGSVIVLRGLRSLLYGVVATDPWILAASGLVLLVTGAIAAYLPARRAAQIDPLAALRHE
jgi:predicted permease